MRSPAAVSNVIWKGARYGSVAKALRTLLKVTAARDGEAISLEIL